MQFLDLILKKRNAQSLSKEEIENEFNKILDGFEPIVKLVEDKFIEKREEIEALKS